MGRIEMELCKVKKWNGIDRLKIELGKWRKWNR